MTTFDHLTSDNYIEILKYINYEDFYMLRLVNKKLAQVCSLTQSIPILTELLPYAIERVLSGLNDRISIPKFLSNIAFDHYTSDKKVLISYHIPLSRDYYTDKLEEVMTAYDNYEFEQTFKLLEKHPEYHAEIQRKAEKDYRGNHYLMHPINFKCSKEVNEIVNYIYATKNSKLGTSMQIRKYLKEIDPIQEHCMTYFLQKDVDHAFLLQYPHWIPLLIQYGKRV